MMKTILTLFVLSIIAVLAIYICYQVALLLRRRKMHKKETEFKKEGITPFGSGLSHGMYTNETGDGVVHDSKPSTAWYSRLS